MAAQNKTRPFGMRDYFGYAMGDFGCNMSFALITNYLMLFYTQYIGLRLSDWAWIIVVGKVWDAINDPLIGGMVDNVRIGKGSKFMPWITIGGSALIIFTTLSFMPIASMLYLQGHLLPCDLLRLVGRLYNGKRALRRAPFVHYQ